ncbi:MAG: DUF2945 domain-containing protein [Caulobacteraceae bacterium]|nr:DUF2945 domain-containing protein [Caulobacter sp.]
MRWTEAGRWFSGRFVRVVTADLVIKGHPLPASPAAPRWLVRTVDGAYAAHPPEAVEPADPPSDPRQGGLDL